MVRGSNMENYLMKKAMKAKSPKSKAMKYTPSSPKPAHKSPLKSKPDTKKNILINLLKRPNGATTQELMAAVGWQQHSVRGFLSGTVKKKLGHHLHSQKPDRGPRRYRILPEGK